VSPSETCRVFECAGQRLIADGVADEVAEGLFGVLHRPYVPNSVGLVFVVGGPQFRVGSHRQFVLMARALSENGYPVFRFDYSGMGDSEGPRKNFQDVGPDIECAIDVLLESDRNIKNVVLLGLCDAASALMINCGVHSKISGLVLINPWARTEKGEAKAVLRHYYGRRLFQRSLWVKAFSGRLKVGQSLSGLARSLVAAGSRSQKDRKTDDVTTRSFIDRMLYGIREFSGASIVLISGRDLTAAEFENLCHRDRQWKKVVSEPRIEFRRIANADHTFSRSEHLTLATDHIIRWLGDVNGPDSQ